MGSYRSYAPSIMGGPLPADDGISSDAWQMAATFTRNTGGVGTQAEV